MASKTTTSSSPKCSAIPRNPCTTAAASVGAVQARREVRIQAPQENCDRPSVQVQGQVQLKRNRFLSYMCTSYRLSTVLEDPDDQSCGSGLLTFGEQYEIHEHKSPVILKFLQERREEEGRFKKQEFEEAETARVPAWRPRRFYSAGSALDERSLPGLFPSFPVGSPEEPSCSFFACEEVPFHAGDAIAEVPRIPML